METSSGPSFKNIVGELLRRHRHGICAVRLKSGSVEFKTTGQWGPKVGLASLIQHQVFNSPSWPSAETRASMKETVCAVTPQPQPWSNLELVTTEDLVDQMRHVPEQWILGLARPAKVGDGLVPLIATKGSMLICAGLAAFVAHSLCVEDREKHGTGPNNPDEPLGWLSVIHELIASEKTDQTWMLGFTRGLEFSWLSRGDK